MKRKYSKVIKEIDFFQYKSKKHIDKIRYK